MARGTTRYWNPSLETLTNHQLLGIQLKCFRGILAYTKTHSAFYQHRLNDIYPEYIQALGDGSRFLLIRKEDLRRAQDDKEPFPFGEMPGVSPEEVSISRQASKTTGKPVYVPESRRLPWSRLFGGVHSQGSGLLRGMWSRKEAMAARAGVPL
jgi:phenylacetate-coenzyme A ligase PaaK-like adenylate-forming protein